MFFSSGLVSSLLISGGWSSASGVLSKLSVFIAIPRTVPGSCSTASSGLSSRFLQLVVQEVQGVYPVPEMLQSALKFHCHQDLGLHDWADCQALEVLRLLLEFLLRWLGWWLFSQGWSYHGCHCDRVCTKFEAVDAAPCPFFLQIGLGRWVGLVTNLERLYFSAAIQDFEGLRFRSTSFFFLGGDGGSSAYSSKNFFVVSDSSFPV